MSPPACATDIREIRIIHKIHAENLDVKSSDCKAGHFRIVHTITTERVSADSSTEQSCQVSHSVESTGSVVQSSPTDCDLNEFKIEHILTVSSFPLESRDRASESRDDSITVEDVVVPMDEVEAKTAVDGSDEGDSQDVDAADNGELQCIEHSVNEKEKGSEEGQENHVQDEQTEHQANKAEELHSPEKTMDEDSSKLSECTPEAKQQSTPGSASSAIQSSNKRCYTRISPAEEHVLGKDFMDSVIVKTEPEEVSELESEGVDFDFPRVTFPPYPEAYKPRSDCPATVTSETIGQQVAEDTSENTPPSFPLQGPAIFPSRESDRFLRNAEEALPLDRGAGSSSLNEASQDLGAVPSQEQLPVDGSSMKPEGVERAPCTVPAGPAPSLPQQDRAQSENGQNMLADIIIKQEVDPDAASCTQSLGSLGNAAGLWPEAVSQQNGARLSGLMQPGSLQRQQQGLNSHRQSSDPVPSTSRGTNNRLLMQDIYNRLPTNRPPLRASDEDSVPLYSQVLSAPTFSLNEIMNHRVGPLFHQRNLPPDCECGTKFRSVQDFNLHQCRATFDRRYSCPVCYKRWGMLDHLKQHMKIHTGQRPHVCNVCGKAFRQSGHLTRHAVIHSGAKPYRCSICGRGFNVSGNCQRHMRIHTTVSNVRQEFECCVCRQVFKTSTDRWYHMLTHTQ